LHKVTVTFEPEGKKVKVPVSSTIFYAVKEAGLNIRSECGGKGICGKCRVIVRDLKAVNKVTSTEKKHLSKSEIDLGYRLACQTTILKDLVVIIPEESRMDIRKIMATGLEKKVKVNPFIKKLHLKLSKPTLTDHRSDFERLADAISKKVKKARLEIDYQVLKELPSILRAANWEVTVTLDGAKIIAVEPGDSSRSLFGFAVDIGTSKIVGHLVDLTNGKTVAIESIENSQVIYGEDVMTRITFAMKSSKNLNLLQKLVIKDINKILSKACKAARINLSNVYKLTVVGNTAMHHFFLGVQPKYLALSPYTPAIKQPVTVLNREIGINANKGSTTTVLPVIAGFVGADAIADVLATEMHKSEETSLLVDIGTNTEIFLGNKNDIICCSCASGPAFEGGHIKHGMKAVTGAIEKIRIRPDFKVEYETIGKVKPKGLCGSAVLDAVAEMLKNRIIDKHGAFKQNIRTKRLKKEGKEKKFVIAWNKETATGKEIVITQKDINEIQLAKAAIYTGCSILMKRKGVTTAEIDKVYIAGAFGNYINLENAKIIGLIPDIPTEKIRFVGNTAIVGAKMALLSKEKMKEAEKISREVRYLELANDPDFEREFVKALLFPNSYRDRKLNSLEY